MSKILYVTELGSKSFEELGAALEKCPEDQKNRFLLEMGLGKWEIWHQHGKKDLYLHCIDTSNPDHAALGFHHLLDIGNEYAKVLDQFFPRLLSPRVHVDNVIQIDCYTPENRPSTLYTFCYALPLLRDKLSEHKEQCREAMGDKKDQTIQGCKLFGMAHLSKWVQDSDQGYWLLHYQEITKPMELSRDRFLRFKDNPGAIKTTEGLREQTGVSYEELFPFVERVFTIEA